MSNTITRKEIADAAGVSVRTVKRREMEWGLYGLRCKSSRRPVLYFRQRTLSTLEKLQIVPN